MAGFRRTCCDPILPDLHPALTRLLAQAIRDSRCRRERAPGVSSTQTWKRPMNSEDTLYGRIKNGVLTLSGNKASIRVDGGCLVVSDGPSLVGPDHVGPAAPIEQRMTTQGFRRADCPINRIVVTRPDGFITFAAIKWLHGVGVGLVQLDWDGTVLVATAPPGNDQPAL